MPSEVKFWRYSIPNTNGYEGWAVLFLDNAGCFTALSDYGDWSYRWNQRGMDQPDMRYFILSCDDDYLLRKINPAKEYDPEKTTAAIRELILGMRRETQLTKEEARDEWELTSSLDTEYEFGSWMRDTNLPDASEVWCVKHSEQARAFLKHCMPRLRELIKNELGL